MQMEWRFGKKVLYATLVEELNLSAVQKIMRHILPALSEGDPPIHLLLDVQEAGSIRMSLKEASSDEYISALHTHPALGWLIYVGNTDNNPFFQFFTSALAQNHDARIRWFGDEAAAIQFLTDLDDRLTPEENS